MIEWQLRNEGAMNDGTGCVASYSKEKSILNRATSGPVAYQISIVDGLRSLSAACSIGETNFQEEQDRPYSGPLYKYCRRYVK